jgi:hypothetical protein
MVAGAVDFVVHLGTDIDGRRVVASVREVVDAEVAQVSSNEIYRPGTNGRADPGVPMRAESLDDLEAAGFDLTLLTPDLGSWER